MTDREVLIDLIRRLGLSVHAVVEDMLPDALAWQPDPAANSIGVTLWHFSRWLDLIRVRALENRPQDDELWFSDGWAARTGYDPRGLGFGGWGALTGYTVAEMRAVPTLTAEQLLAYFDACASALSTHLALPGTAPLDSPAPGLQGVRPTLVTIYDWLIVPLLGCFGHVGEMAALKTLQQRAVTVA